MGQGRPALPVCHLLLQTPRLGLLTPRAGGIAADPQGTLAPPRHVPLEWPQELSLGQRNKTLLL